MTAGHRRKQRRGGPFGRYLTGRGSGLPQPRSSGRRWIKLPGFNIPGRHGMTLVYPASRRNTTQTVNNSVVDGARFSRQAPGRLRAASACGRVAQSPKPVLRTPLRRSLKKVVAIESVDKEFFRQIRPRPPGFQGGTRPCQPSRNSPMAAQGGLLLQNIGGEPQEREVAIASA